MKRIVVPSKRAGNLRLEGLSSPNGISIYHIPLGGEDSAVTGCSSFATVDDHGNVVQDKCPNFSAELKDKLDKHFDYSEKIKLTSRKIVNILLLMAMAFVIFAIFTNNYSRHLFFGLGFLFYSLSRLDYVLVLTLKRDEETMQMFRFHGAEHAVINAYYDLKRVPTLEEIKGYSVYSAQCFCMETIADAWPSMVFAISFFAPGLWTLLCAIIMFAVCYWMIAKTDIPLYAQKLVISEPTDMEYKVAIAALACTCNEVTK